VSNESSVVAEPISESRSILGEGPLYSQFGRGIMWVDILGRKIRRISTDGIESAMDSALQVGSIFEGSDEEVYA